MEKTALEFNKLLILQINYCSLLIKALAKERSILEKVNSFKDLEESTQEKELILTNINHVNSQIIDTLKEVNLELSNENVKKLITQIPEKLQKIVSRNWLILKDHLKELQISNEINNKITQVCQTQIGKLLNTLYGNNNGKLYTSSAKTYECKESGFQTKA